MFRGRKKNGKRRKHGWREEIDGGKERVNENISEKRWRVEKRECTVSRKENKGEIEVQRKGGRKGGKDGRKERVEENSKKKVESRKKRVYSGQER